MGKGRGSWEALDYMVSHPLRAVVSAWVSLALMGCVTRGNPAGAAPLPASQAEQLPAVRAETTASTPPADGVHSATQMAALVPLNAADSPWSLAELRKAASPDDGPEVWLAGYVNMADCAYAQTNAPKPCLLASFADHPFAAGNERVLVGGVPNSWEKLPPRARVRVLVSYDRTLVGPLEFSRDKEALNYIDHVEPKPLTPAPPKAATFADGSWSVADLLSRDELQLDTPLDVTAYVIHQYQCPPCPRTAKCKPCSPPSLTLGDVKGGTSGPSLLVAGFTGHSLPAKFDPSKRYTFSGTFRGQASGWSSDGGGMLEYRAHMLARQQ